MHAFKELYSAWEQSVSLEEALLYKEKCNSPSLDVLASVLLSTWHRQDHLERENLSWENESFRLAYRQVCRVFFKINDWYWNIQPTIDISTHGQLILGCLRKQAEQVMGSKPVKQHSSAVPAAVPAFRFLLLFLPDFRVWQTMLRMYKSSKSFLSKLFLVMVFATAVESKQMQSALG